MFLNGFTEEEKNGYFFVKYKTCSWNVDEAHYQGAQLQTSAVQKGSEEDGLETNAKLTDTTRQR